MSTKFIKVSEKAFEVPADPRYPVDSVLYAGRSSCIPETERCNKANNGCEVCTGYCKVSLLADVLNLHGRILLVLHACCSPGA